MCASCLIAATAAQYIRQRKHTRLQIKANQYLVVASVFHCGPGGERLALPHTPIRLHGPKGTQAPGTLLLHERPGAPGCGLDQPQRAVPSLLAKPRRVRREERAAVPHTQQYCLLMHAQRANRVEHRQGHGSA